MASEGHSRAKRGRRWLLAAVGILAYALLAGPRAWLLFDVLDVDSTLAGRVEAGVAAGVLGDRMLAERDAAGAVRAFERALELTPSVEAHTRLAEARLRSMAEAPDRIAPDSLDDLDFSRKWLLEQDPVRYGELALAVAGQLALLRGDADSAERDFRLSLGSGLGTGQGTGQGTGLGNLGLGMIARARGDTATACEEFARAAAQLPGSEYAQLACGDACLAGAPAKAEAAYSAALAVRASGRAHRGLANALLARKAVDAAVAEYRNALKLDPKDADSLAAIGSALAGKGALAEARDALEAAIAIRPEVAIEDALLGVLIEGRHFQAAFDLADSIEERRRLSPDLCPRVARAHEENGQRRNALEVFLSCVESLSLPGAGADTVAGARLLDEARAGVERLTRAGFRPREEPPEAEAQGNRTPPGRDYRPTPVLKTGEPTRTQAPPQRL